MARTDRAAFAAVLREAEGEMDALFQQLAVDVGNLVLRAQGEDGTVPIERLQELQKQAGRLVDAAFLGGPERKPFDEENEPQAAFPRLLAEGQWAMVDLALERQVRILERVMPAQLRDRLAARWRMVGR